MPDAEVSAAREEFSRREYDELRQGVLTMQQRALEVETASGSILERENAQTSFFPITYQVRWQLQLAAAHLMALDNLIQSGGLPYVAGYPLIRAAVESAAQAHWQLQHAHTRQRVLRSLRISWWDHRDAMRFGMSIGKYDTAFDERIQDAIRSMKERVKALSQAELDVERTSHTDILIDVERKLKLPMPTPLQTWQLASSMTHGNTLTPGSTMQRKAIDPAHPNVYVAYASWHLTVPLIRTTVQTFEAALNLFTQRASQSA